MLTQRYNCLRNLYQIIAELIAHFVPRKEKKFDLQEVDRTNNFKSRNNDFYQINCEN